MALIWVFLATVASVLPKVLPLQCYSCSREDSPDASKHCALLSPSTLGNNSIINCTGNEDRCGIVKAIAKSGMTTTFRRSCKTEQSCEDSCSAPNTDGVVVCESCCDKDLCNKGTGPPRSAATRAHTAIWSLHAVIGGYLLLFCL